MSLQARKCSLISTRHAREGYLFNETWICTDVSLVNKEGRYTMPDRDVYFCGRFAKNDDTMVMLGVEVYVDGNPETHYTLYTNKGETVTLPDIFMDGYAKSYESDKLTVTNGNVTIRQATMSLRYRSG
ncbi:MAG: hypothetical protein ACLTZI_12920 [[Eubacterium] siraeum]